MIESNKPWCRTISHGKEGIKLTEIKIKRVKAKVEKIHTMKHINDFKKCIQIDEKQ